VERTHVFVPLGFEARTGAFGPRTRTFLREVVEFFNPFQLDVKDGWLHRLDTELCHGGQARGCGARLLWLSLPLSGGAQNRLTGLLRVFRSALASAFCYSMDPNRL
jgi:hypothetical protein